MLYSKQKVFCNCCGKELFIELPAMMGGSFLRFRVCSEKCIREMRWREALSILGKEYEPDPQAIQNDK